MRLRGVPVLFVFFGLPSIADIDIRTDTLDVYYRGSCETAGQITFSVNGDDFPAADPAAPVYIRIRLEQNVTLCSTLVAVPGTAEDVDCCDRVKPFCPVEGEPPVTCQDVQRVDPYAPMYLAMRKEPLAGPGSMNAPPECVSIVRWIQGERDIWLRIQNPTPTWLSSGAPSTSTQVAWTLGVNARQTFNRNSSGYPSTSNLPANTKTVLEIIANPGYREGFAVSTLLCLNLTQSTLLPMPSAQSHVSHEVAAFDSSTTGVTTEPDPNAIQLGAPLPVVMGGDETVARGFEVDCQAHILPSPPVTAPLCDPAGTETLAFLENEFDVEVFYEPGFFQNSYFHLLTPPNSSYGFRVMTRSSGQPLVVGYWGGEPIYGVYADIQGPWHFLPFAFEDMLFQIGNKWLSREVVLFCLTLYEPSVPGSIFSARGDAQIGIPCGSAPQDVILQFSAAIANHDRPFDVYPFDGTMDDGDPSTGITIFDQARNCPQVYRYSEPQTIVFGHFILAVPTLSKIALIAFTVLLAAAAVVVSRRRRQREAGS